MRPVEIQTTLFTIWARLGLIVHCDYSEKKGHGIITIKSGAIKNKTVENRFTADAQFAGNSDELRTLFFFLYWQAGKKSTEEFRQTQTPNIPLKELQFNLKRVMHIQLSGNPQLLLIFHSRYMKATLVLCVVPRFFSRDTWQKGELWRIPLLLPSFFYTHKKAPYSSVWINQDYYGAPFLLSPGAGKQRELGDAAVERTGRYSQRASNDEPTIEWCWGE